jgi:hypothetical protein
VTLKKALINSIPKGIYEEYIFRGHLKRMRIKSKGSNKHAIKYKDKFKDERCFIMGSGPSIKDVDITKLQDEYVIYLNHGYVHPDYKTLKKTIHFNSGLAIHKYTADGEKEFYHTLESKSNDLLYLINSLDYEILAKYNFLLDRDILYFTMGLNWDYFDRVGIDLTKGIYPGGNSMVNVIQIAIYLGFKEIYLIGFDFDWIKSFLCKKGVVNHFYDDSNPELKLRLKQSGFDKIIAAYYRVPKYLQTLNEYLKPNNGAIYNLSINSMINSVEKLKFSEVI